MTDSLESIEDEMACHPLFGLPSGVTDRSQALYEFSLEILSDRLPLADQLRAKLQESTPSDRYNFLRDPVLRHVLATAIQDQNKDSEQSSEKVMKILKAANESLERSLHQSPLEAEVRGSLILHLGTDSNRTFIWASERATGPCAEYFLELVRTELSTGTSADNVVLRSPNAAMYRTIEEGADILVSLVPKLTRSVLPHAQMIGVVDVVAPVDPDAMYRSEIFESASTDTIPGTVFLSPNSLANSWRAGEALLHEAAHNKLFELIMSCSILREGYAQKESDVSILAFWNKENPSNPRDWSVDRALLACHVYVYLALFFAIIEQRVKNQDVRIATGGAIDASRTAATSFARASYLEEQLRERAWGEMGHDGHRLMDWMRARLEQLRAYVPSNALAEVLN